MDKIEVFKKMMKELDEIAEKEFLNVPDDVRFRNYSNKDIWISGFKEGLLYYYYKTLKKKQ